MEVIKRDGSKEKVKLDKILNRVKKQCYGLNMDYIEQKVLQAPMVEMLGKTTDTTEFFVKTYTALKLSAEPWCAKIINVKDNTLT